MPFTALVQRQFTLRTFSQAHEAFSIGKTPGITTSTTKRRRAGLIKENCSGGREPGSANDAPSEDGAHIPAWVRHLDSFRRRSFCAASSVPTRPTALLGSAMRSVTNQQLLHQSIVKPSASPSVVQARQCKTSAQYIKDMEELVRGNEMFRQETLRAHPQFFEESAKGQST